MSLDKEKAFLEQVQQHLDRDAENLDDLTAARLAALRRTALAQPTRRVPGWLPVGGVAAATATLLAVVLWNGTSGGLNGLPGDPALLAQVEDLELIEELEFYAWLDEIEANS